MPAKIMIIAGEASGDLHGGSLIQALRQRSDDVEIFGVGGDNMRNAGMELYYHVDQLAYIGFSEVLKHYFYFRRIFNHLMDVLETRNPDILILIDYPGFNLRFAKAAKKKGQKNFYFIAPQVWAWAQGRAKKMAKYIDKLAVLFDFEVNFFTKFGIDTSFVGHPLVEKLQVKEDKEQFCKRFNLKSDKPILGLFPGSRKQELTNLLPAMLETAQELVKKHPDLQITVSKASSITKDEFQDFLPDNLPITIIEGFTYDLMKHVTAGIVASGTATLEMGCMQTPFVIVYKVSNLSYQIGKRVVKIPYIGLVNVVSGKKVVNEFIQDDVQVEKIMPEMEKLLFDTEYQNKARINLQNVRNTLGTPGAAARTADLVLKMINKK